MAAFAVSCSKENQVEEPQAELANDVIHISANVSFDETKALDWTASGVTAKFGANEYLYVYKDGTFIVRLTNGTGGGSSFEGDIPAASLTEGDNSVTLYYLQDGALADSPAESSFTGLTYTTQDGTQDGVTKFDLAQGTSTITKSGSTAGFAGTITLSAQQAILQVTLNDVSEETGVTNFNKLEVRNGSTTYTATLASGTNTIFYIAIPAASSANYTFLATTDGNKKYWGYKASATIVNGNAYKTTVNLEKFDVAEGVTLGTAGTWANMNYNDGTNLSKVTDYGKFYTYEQAKDIPGCPSIESDLKALDKGWFTLDGVTGRVFGTTDHHIFLPAAGFSGGDFAGDGGYYWSSTPYLSDQAWLLYFNKDYASDFYNIDVSYKCSVRLVAPTE